MIVGISGTHGVGKTTMLYKLAHDFKIRYGRSKVRVLSEVTRGCPIGGFFGSKTSSVEAQLWMFSRHMEQELGARSSADILLMDRTLYDYVAYTEEVDEDLAVEMLGMMQWVEYDKIHFVRPTGVVVGDGERSTDPALRARIDIRLERLLASVECEVREVKIHRIN